MKYYFEKYKEEYFKVLYGMKKDNFKWYVEKLYGWDEETQTQFQKDFIEEHRNDINVIKVDNEIIGVFTNYINENNESEIKELSEIWKNEESKLAFYMEHNELEQISSKMTNAKISIENDNLNEAILFLDEIKFRIEHIKNKQKMELKNIF